MPDYFPEKPWGCNCGCGRYGVDAELIHRLNSARGIAKVPFQVTSSLRCPDKNAAVGGAANSAHLTGHAVDISCRRSADRYVMVQALMIAGFTRIEVAPAHIHVDVDPTKPHNVLWLKS
jgi:uncharacterized protein YcbK (DUF882 family)